MNPRVSLCGVAEEGGRYLVAKRNLGGSQGGKWEFPGGKLETPETSQEGVRREFGEELRVEVNVKNRIFTGSFSNGGKTFLLEAWRVELLSRDFQLIEHQELRWVAPAEFQSLDLSESDRQVADFLLGAASGSP